MYASAKQHRFSPTNWFQMRRPEVTFLLILNCISPTAGRKAAFGRVESGEYERRNHVFYHWRPSRFSVPIWEGSRQTDYYLLFQKGPALKYKLVYGDSGTADAAREYTLNLEEADGYYRCPITEHMFDRDALIFDDTQVEWVGIGYPDGTPYVVMECEGFTNFGIWTMPGGPYICLEPWMGRCDDYGFAGDISDKKDVITLKEGETFDKSYRMTFISRPLH